MDYFSLFPVPETLVILYILYETLKKAKAFDRP